MGRKDDRVVVDLKEHSLGDADCCMKKRMHISGLNKILIGKPGCLCGFNCRKRNGIENLYLQENLFGFKRDVADCYHCYCDYCYFCHYPRYHCYYH